MTEKNNASADHRQEVDDRESPSAQVLHDTIYKEAEKELSRSSSALFWSGLAAGLSMGFSMITEGLLMAYLPDTEWEPLVSNFGYSIGFLIVILGRQQLFTENTLTPILPFLQRKDTKTLIKVLKLWAVVLLANLLGALLIAFLSARTMIFDHHVQKAFLDIGLKAIEPPILTTFLRGIMAGWLIALMVWLLPYAETARVWVIIIITYIVGIGHFSHVIAGAVEIFTLGFMNEASWWTTITHYLLPTLFGNIIGGVIIVAALNHAQTVATK